MRGLLAGIAACGIVATLCPPARAQEAREIARTPQGKPGLAYAVELVLIGDADERSTVENASTLKDQADKPPADADGLVRRARNDAEGLIAALYAEARYGAVVSIEVAGRPVTAVDAPRAAAAAAIGGVVPVRITVTTGPEFKIGSVRFVRPDGRPDPALAFEPQKFRVEPGRVANSTAILQAEPRIVDALREQGRPLAAVKGRDVVADHAAQTVAVTYRVDPGAVARYAPVEVKGTQDVDPVFVARRVPFQPGETFDPKDIKRLRDDLVRLDVFRSVRIVEGDRLNPDGTLPISIEVTEKPPRFVGASASYGTVDGASVAAYWGHRNLFGQAERLRLDASVSRFLQNELRDLEYKFGATFTKPSIFTPRDDLIAELNAMREAPDAYTRRGVLGALSIERRQSDTLTLRGGAEFEASSIIDYFGKNKFLLLGVPLQATYDTTDDRLDPTRGFRATLLGEPMFSLNDKPSFGILRGTVSAYRSIDEASRFVVAGRLSAGTLFGGDVSDIPANRRFFAGGGGSIRGFKFQHASPRAPDGTLIGGKSLVEGSLELRYRFSDTISIVPFVDAGAAFRGSVPDLGEQIRVAAGIGARYHTRIGPLRVDFAVPVVRERRDPTFAVYVGLGQAF